MEKEELKLGGGLFEAIKNYPVEEHEAKPFSLKEFERLMIKAGMQDSIRRRERDKVVKSNIKELLEKSEKFGEPIPIDVWFHATSNPMTFVGSDFIKRHKKWIQ